MTLLIDGSSEALFETEVYQSPESDSTNFDLLTNGISTDADVSSQEVVRERDVLPNSLDGDASDITVIRLRDLFADSLDFDVASPAVSRIRDLVIESLDPEESQSQLRRTRTIAKVFEDHELRTYTSPDSNEVNFNLQSGFIDSRDEDISNAEFGRARSLEVAEGEDADRFSTVLDRLRLLEQDAEDRDQSFNELLRERNLFADGEDKDKSQHILDRVRDLLTNAYDVDTAKPVLDRLRIIGKIDNYTLKSYTEPTSEGVNFNLQGGQIDSKDTDKLTDVVFIRERDVFGTGEDIDESNATVNRFRDVFGEAEDTDIANTVLDRLRLLESDTKDIELSNADLIRERDVFGEAQDIDLSDGELERLIARTLNRELTTDERVLIIEDIETGERVLIMTDGVI